MVFTCSSFMSVTVWASIACVFPIASPSSSPSEAESSSQVEDRLTSALCCGAVGESPVEPLDSLQTQRLNMTSYSGM